MLLFIALSCSGDTPGETKTEATQEPLAGTSLKTVVDGPVGEIGPIGPGELAPPSLDFGDGLKILMVGPTGEQHRPKQAVVVFERPMIPLGELGTAPVPLSCDSPGEARWAGTTTAVFLPNGGHFPRSTQVTCTVGKGVTATDGTALSVDLQYSFATTTPSLSWSSPRSGSEQADPERPVLLVFDQPVDPEEVQQLVRLTSEGGAPLKVKAERPDPAAFEDERLPKKLERAVALSAPMERDTAYTLVLEAGLSGLEGSLGQDEPMQLDFRTYPPADILDFHPTGTSVDPYTTLRLELATVTEAEEIASRMTISPPPPDGWDPARAYSWRDFSYSLRLDPMTTYKVTLDKGAKDTHGQDYATPLEYSFTTGHLRPMVDATSGARIYPANNSTELPTRTRNVRSLHVGVEALSAAQAMRMMGDYSTFRRGERSLSEHTTLFDGRDLDDRIHVDTIDLAEDLSETGHGFVLVETWSPDWANHKEEPYYNKALLQVTDLGSTLKVHPGGVQTWVTRLSDGQPVEGASVTLYRSGKKIWSGPTDADGLAASNDVIQPGWRYWDEDIIALVEFEGDASLTSSEDPHRLDVWDYDVMTSGPDEERTLRGHFFADRGVYKPGDEVHVAGSVRLAHATGLDVASGAVEWWCEDARGAMLAEGKGRLDEGRLSFDLELPDEMAAGTAGCNIELDAAGLDEDSSWWVAVPVHAYRAPTFRVEVGGPEHALVGEEFTVSGQGSYLFGAAMGGASARWSARTLEIQPSIEGFEEFTVGGDESQAWWDRDYVPSELLAEGQTQLEDDGSLPIVLTVPQTEEPATRTVEVEVQVTDEARRTLSNRSHVTVHPSAVYLGLRGVTGLGRVGEGATMELVALSPEGQVLRNTPVEFSVQRRSWDTIRQKGMDGRWEWVSTANDEQVHRETVTTEAQPMRVGFTPEQGGYYVFTATAQDSEGRATRTELGLYVAGAGATWARGDSNQVELVPDKRSYSPGETASVLIKAPKPGMKALVTVERERLLTRQVITLQSEAETLEIPLTEEHAPNVYVSVLLTEGAPPADSPDAGMPSWYLGYVELDVSPEGRRLEVEIDPGRQTFQPGEQVTLNLSATRGDEPAAGARAVVYAVDHGVLSLTAYSTPDPFIHFWARHSLNVRTADARTRVVDRGSLLAKGAPAGGDGGDSGPAMRSRFETTPLWEPDVVFDEQGLATLDFTLPDNLTTFRIMVVIEQGEEAFGSAEHEIQVSRPLIANPALPRVFRVGDTATAGVVVHNNRDVERRVAVTADAFGIELEGSPTTVTVPAHSALEVPFALSEPVVGVATFHFDVQADGDRDRVEAKVPVLRPVPVETVATAGSGTQSMTETLALVDGAQQGVGGLSVSLSPSVLVGTEASLDYLIDYPHGCLEQTSSRLLAAVLAKELGFERPKDQADLDSVVAAGMSRLELFELASGGYSYWPGQREPSVLATAHVTEVLHEARRAGIGEGPREETITFLRAFLDGRWTPTWWHEDTIWSARARVALTLARVGEGDSGWNSRLYEERARLSLTGRAELLEAIALTTGPDSRTDALRAELEGNLYVEATRAVVQDPDSSRWSALMDGDMGPTAAAVRALVAAYPQQALLPRLAEGLVASREQGRWGNTYTTLKSFQALARYVEVYEKDRAAGAIVKQGGRKILEASFATEPSAELFVPIDDIDSTEFSMEPKGGRLYYELRLAYGKDELPARDAGFTVTRTLTVLEGEGGQSQVTPGALVQVDLRITTPIDRSYVAIVDPLPAGLEPVNTFFATSASSLGEGGRDSGGYYGGYYGGFEDTAADEGRTWSDWVFNHREMLDDRVQLYADWMPAGVHTYSYVARATTPGEYSHPAATAEEMYRPENFGRTEQGRFVVGPSQVAAAE